MLQDKTHNTKMVYLYVNKFDYCKNQLDKEQASGHPKPKRIYRAIYNTDTDSYRLIHEVTSTNVSIVYVQDLQSKEEELGISCDIKILTAMNILDFLPIPEDNLDELLTWLKTDNKDIKTLLGDIGAPKPSRAKSKETDAQPQPLPPPGKGIKLSPELVQYINLGQKLNEIDPIIFGTIFDLLVYLIENTYADTGVVSTGWLRLDKEHGAGVNVSAAVEKLSKYLGQDRRVNLDDNDLMGAIKDLLTEKSRRIYHDIQ